MFLRKLAGKADLEDALKKLDGLTQEEARLAHAEDLRITHSIRDGIKNEDDKAEDVGDKVPMVIDGARGFSGRFSNPFNVYTFRRQASKSSGVGHR